MKAYIYTRISPRPTKLVDGVRVAQHDSTDTQEELCRSLCEDRGWPVAGCYRDLLKSGSDSTREAYNQAVADCVADKGVLVAYQLSRVARSTAEILKLADKLEAKGARLCIVSGGIPIDNTTPQGRLIMTMIAAIDEFNRASKAEETKAYRAAHAAAGKYCGGSPPYGKRLCQGELVDDAFEQSVIKRILQLYQFHGPSKIARILNEEPVIWQPRKGKWSRTKVARVLNMFVGEEE